MLIRIQKKKRISNEKETLYVSEMLEMEKKTWIPFDGVGQSDFQLRDEKEKAEEYATYFAIG